MIHSLSHLQLISCALIIVSVTSSYPYVFTSRISAFHVSSSSLEVNKRGNTIQRRRKILNLLNDDDDDGWGTDTNDESLSIEKGSKIVQNLKTPPPSRSFSTEGKDQPRDLFIPGFALLSLVLLFGSYGYEMIRLNSEGQLYLPWQN